MKAILKVCAFLLANIVSFVSISIVFHAFQKAGHFSDINDPAAITTFFQNAMLTWASGALISIGFFVMNNKAGLLLLTAPLCAVIGYSLKLAFISS